MDSPNGSDAQASRPQPAFRPINRSMLEPVRDPVPVDGVDLALLRLLAADARTSQRQLARSVEMSAGAVGERLARLERLGVLQHYTVTVDWGRLGLPVLVYLPIVAVVGTDIGEILEQLTALPEVESINIVSGAYDLLVSLRVRDNQHLTELLLDRIWPIPSLQRTETVLCLAASKQKNFTEELLSVLLERASADAATTSAD